MRQQMNPDQLKEALDALKRIAMGASNTDEFHSDCRTIYRTLINIQSEQQKSKLAK